MSQCYIKMCYQLEIQLYFRDFFLLSGINLESVGITTVGNTFVPFWELRVVSKTGFQWQ